MKMRQSVYAVTILALMLVTSGCVAKQSTEGVTNSPAPTQLETTDGTNSTTDNKEEEQQILIVIDQTPKPIQGNSFDFGVKKLPPGYSLSAMEWDAKDNHIKNTIADAVQHGQDGNDGFYISGDGQMMGFFYEDKMKGEQGKVIFTFQNDQGHELTWKKELTLK
jgi:hypothetical protein